VKIRYSTKENLKEADILIRRDVKCYKNMSNNHIYKLKGTQRVHISANLIFGDGDWFGGGELGWRREMCLVMEMDFGMEMGSGCIWVGDGNGLGREMGLGVDMGCMSKMADALWEGHTLLKTGWSVRRHTQTDRQK